MIERIELRIRRSNSNRSSENHRRSCMLKWVLETVVFLGNGDAAIGLLISFDFGEEVSEITLFGVDSKTVDLMLHSHLHLTTSAMKGIINVLAVDFVIQRFI